MELIRDPRLCGDGLDWGRRDMVDFTFFLLNYKNESLDDKFVVECLWITIGSCWVDKRD